MRIAFFSDNFYPEVSGISDSIIALGAELTKRGHEVCYDVPYYAPRDYTPLQGKTAAHDVRDDLPIKRLPSLFFPGSPTGHGRIVVPFGASLGFIRRFKPDILHTQSPYGAGLEALLVSRILHIPLVGTNHTPIEAFVQYAPFGKFFLKRAAPAYDAWYYNRCRFVTAPYQGLLDLMRTRGFKRPGKGLPNPILINDFTLPSQQERDDIRRTLHLQGPVMLYAGRLAPEKQVDVAIKALVQLIEKFPTLTLIITGHGSAEADLKILAERLGVAKHVRFLGFLSKVELARAYKTADVFIMMSVAETHSIALMQAFASGVPAVSARAGALPEFTPPQCGFVVEPGDDRALAEKVATLLGDQALAQRMGEAGVAFVQQFAPSAIAAKWEQIYEEALRKR